MVHLGVGAFHRAHQAAVFEQILEAGDLDWAIRGVSLRSPEVRDRLAASGASLDDTDGVRVTTSDGWWLLRASNTQDVLVARAEAKDEAGVARLIAEIDDQLAKSGVLRAEAVH